MTIFDPKVFLEIIKLNKDVVKQHTKGLSHEESLLLPPNEGNSMNWVLGHVIECRNEVFEILEIGSVWSLKECELYRTGSTPLNLHENAVDLFDLIEYFSETQTRLKKLLTDSTTGSMAQLIKFHDQDMHIGELINFYLWHETYHLGQMEQLRRLAGKLEKIYG